MGEEISIKEIWKIIRKNYSIIILSVFIFSFSAFLYSKFSKPVYRSAGKIYVGPPKIEIKSLNDIIMADYGERVIKTQIELLKSSQVLKIASEKLNKNYKHRDTEVDSLIKHINVSAVEGTYIIEVSAEHSSPQMARDIVNAVISAYFEFQKSTFATDVSNTLLSITDRLIETKERLRKSEEDLIEFVKKYDFGVESRDEDGSLVAKMKNVLTEKKMELVSLKSKYGNKHPLVTAKEREIAGMEKLFEEERRKLLTQKEKEIRFSILQRDAEVEREIYNTLLREMKKIDVMSNIKDMDIKLIEEASLPLHPVKPGPFRSCLFGAFAGFMIGIIAIFIMENLDTTIKRESEIEENYNLPILASIPHIKFQEFSEVLNLKGGIYDKFYSILTLAGFISPNPKTFLIVSGGIGEGKTFLSLLFSASLASGGNKVLLVDMDFKGHTLKELLKVKNNYGLSNCLLGEISTKDAISGTDIKNLYLLPAGENPPISPSLLLKKKFQELHGELRESYDYIVIDTPPILLYSHPLEIVNLVDFIILIVRSNHSTKQDLKRVISLLRGVKAKAMGAVFNYAEERRYYYRYYYPS